MEPYCILVRACAHSFPDPEISQIHELIQLITYPCGTTPSPEVIRIANLIGNPTYPCANAAHQIYQETAVPRSSAKWHSVLKQCIIHPEYPVEPADEPHAFTAAGNYITYRESACA